MSRFSLRSNADNFKITDDKFNRQKFCKTVTVPIKRIQTTAQFLRDAATNPQKDNSNKDVIKRETKKEESATKTSTTSITTTITTIIGGSSIKKQIPAHDVVDSNCVSSTNGRTLLCRLPLIRLTDILEKLKINKTPNVPLGNLDLDLGDEANDEDDEEEEGQEKRDIGTEGDNVTTKSTATSATVKILCLYCDKKFSSHKMQLKHVDKFHCQQQDRRCSGRKPPVTQTTCRKRKTTFQPSTSPQSFPGCSFCHKAVKGGNQNSPLNPLAVASDLNALFVHLIDCHADKYYGCKTCAVRFQNVTKLSKHMQLVHKRLPYAHDDSSSKSKDNDTDTPMPEKIAAAGSTVSERNQKLTLKRNQQRSQISRLGPTNINAIAAYSNSSGACGGGGGGGVGGVSGGGYCMPSLCVGGPTTQCSTAIIPDTTVIGAEEPILSRLGLTQNRLPNNRKGVRLRRENLLPEALLKSEQNTCANFISSSSSSLSSSLSGSTNSIASSSNTNSSSTTCSPKLRGKAIKYVSNFSSDATPTDIIFRVPTRNDILSCVFDDNFYKEVISNVRNNLLFHLDGKILSKPTTAPVSHNNINTTPTNNSLECNAEAAMVRYTSQPQPQPPLAQIRSTLVKSPIVVTTLDHSEIHAATTLAATTAFPTLLTAEQYGGDAISSKLRRPHTKNSWKWKWDNVKKFKIVSEGGKMVKKMKHPMFGLRDLSKLDMWTQLTMRQKHEYQSTNQQHNEQKTMPEYQQIRVPVDGLSREVKQRLNEQLNWILDMRLLPHIILEQNEQAIIKLENDEFGITPCRQNASADDDIDVVNGPIGMMHQTFADESFLSMLNLLPNHDSQAMHQPLVLSGEWARPRCYLCMCCGAKFEKLKSLEEHKMFRHSHILSNHYEVVGRELLAGNLLRHLFIPKKALSRYGNDLNPTAQQPFSNVSRRRLFWHKNETLLRELHATHNEESSDCSLQSVLNSTTSSPPSTKTPSYPEDCDTDTKMNPVTTAPNNTLDLINPAVVVSPAHSIQSCSSSVGSHSNSSKQLKAQSNVAGRAISICSKCKRQCNGLKDLYRHMLDCSGDYVWSMAKKRKYRYYCGSKKRRPCNKHHLLELRRNKPKVAKAVVPTTTMATATNSLNHPTYNSIKPKTPPRPRPSDAESIKKMLENLPPKRVCKKIFPLLTKARSSKQLKPKMMVKQKIYRRLRKTRMRQLAQAARFLTKNKTQQMQQRRKKRTSPVKRGMKHTASAFTSSSAHITKQSSLCKADNKKIPDKSITPQQMSNEKKKEVEGRDDIDGGAVAVAAAVPPDTFKKNVDHQGSNKDVPDKDEKRKLEKTSSKEIVESNKGVNNKEVEDEAPAPNKCKVSKDPDGLIISKNINTTMKNTDDLLAKPLTINITDTQTPAIKSGGSKISVAPLSSLMPSPVLLQEHEKNSQISNNNNNNNNSNNKNNKRSKRINDCIAMLTGKLAEKLRTETGEKAFSYTTNNNNNDNDTSTMNMPNSSRKDALMPMLLPIETVIMSTPEVTITKVVVQQQQCSPDFKEQSRIAVTSNCSPKKTPKRKTISRRIIKPPEALEMSTIIPIMEHSTTTATIHTLQQNIPTTSLPLANKTKITTTTTPASATITTPLTLPSCSSAAFTNSNISGNHYHHLTPIMLKPAVTTDISSTVKQIMISPAKAAINSNNRSNKTTTTTTAVVGTPAVANAPTNIIPVCTLNMMPKVPLHIPVAAVAAHMGHLSLPLPLPMPVGMPLIENASQISPSSATNGTPSPLVGPGIVAPVLPLVNASLAMPVHFTASNALPLNVINFNSEPLNLSSASKNLQPCNVNDSQDLTCSNNARSGVGLMPARRQTICGFEARNFVLYDEMEPLDLSKKSGPSAAQSNFGKMSTAMLPPAHLLTSSSATAAAITVQSTSSLSLAPTSLQQQQQHQQQPPITALAPISEPGGVLTISALTPEMLSKHFYSNLDLLRIPQIRNSAPASGCSTVTTTTEFDAVSITNSSNCNNTSIVNSSNISVTSTAVTPSSTAVITTPKSNNKKRNSKSAQNNSNTMTVASSASIIEVVNAVATYSTSTMSTPTPTTRAKETNSKCKDNMKNKVLLKMDEEVINHIDDAINSVINAVKASLKDSEEAEKLQQQQHQQSLNMATVLAQSPQQPCLSQIQSMPIAINQINTAPALTKETASAAVAVTAMPVKQTINEVKYLTQSKRSTRSKTLDCRPTALSKMQSFGNIQSEKTTVPIKPDQCVELKKVKDISYQSNITSAIISVHKEEQQVTAVTSTMLLPAEVENDAKKASTITQVNSSSSSTINKSNSKDLITLSAVKSDGGTVSETLDNKEFVAQVRESGHGTVNTSSSLASVGMENNLLVQDSNCRSAAEKVREARTTGSLSTETESVANTIMTTSATTITTNNTTLELEQISNINNTSSGFHSSVQSEQNLTGAVSSTTTNTTTTTQTVEAPNTNETKTKKQRKRRKNELAAIVADQLLESFKIDKVRRDNLKKLENLAYEKSEDLLLTGMLLMSSTKRTVVAAGAGSGTTIESIESSSNGGVNKRNKSTRNANSTNETVTRSATQATSMKLNNGDKVDGKSRSGAGKQANVKDVDNREPGQTDDRCAKKPVNNKRRPCRGRRGKTLDNENISKLKSSLESFSIDIERQLTEFEAKNVNVFKNVNAATTTTNNASGASGRNNSNLTKGATPPKSSIILRPSILSVTLEAANHNNNSQQASKLTTNGDTSSKSVVSSRDPRLNKNIHKEKGGGGALATLRKSPKSKTSGAVAADDIGDVDEDNYLTEIAKNVNEKIMSTDNEEFAFKDDGFEMVHELHDDSNSKFSRPPTSMSVRSAPNFNDDRSNFDSTCDENTNINTEALDMDLDDDMSVYTSYSQDLGRGRGGRRRRRRRSILLRKNKKRPSSRERINDKIECILCKKTFYSANSLAKHNMTLAHVSKVSEQEYLLSKKMGNATAAAVISNEASRHGSLGPYARRTTRRATISEPFCHISTNSISHDSLMKETVRERLLAVPPRIPTPPRAPLLIPTVSHAVEVAANVKQPSPPQEMPSAITIAESQQSLETKIEVGPKLTEALSKASPINPPCEPNSSTHNLTAFSSNSRLNLNPDERLFFECCNILKGAETHRITSHIAGSSHPSNYAYVYNQEKVGHSTSISSNVSLVGQTAQQHENTVKKSLTFPPPPHIQPPSTCHSDMVNITESASIFRDPHNVVAPSGSSYNKATQERNMRSPTYSGTSQLSAVTNTTTSRFKTKAAMKGYENVNVDLTLQQHESKSRTICKLTELAEIALGNEEKQGSRSQQHFSPICGDDSDDDSTPVNGIIQTPTAPVATSTPITPLTNHVDNIVIEQQQNMMTMNTPEYASLSGVVEHAKNCLHPSAGSTLRNERNKNNETRSSTSSKTIMHSSIIKAAVEEHQKAAPSFVKNNKIVIPDRPFKNIGLEEKESITFQKPKTSAVNLLTDDNSVSTASFSDRDDYDFGSLSCEDEVSVHEEIGNHDGKHLKNSSSESSSESSRATAKTFENKSLIMGRIFKNASTKPLSTKNAITAVKVKSVGVQKDQTPTPKADLNQLFDELRGGGNSRGAIQANHERTTATATSINQLTNQGVGAGLIKSATVGSRSALSNNVRKESARKETLTTANLSKPQQKTVQAASPPAVVSSTTSTPRAGVRKAREARNKSGANVTNRKTRKDISKLQSELGMSPDEIKKLIDEGQRKSKRRCATNRPKKLVEMWSSDEYEEFLSTKDIIALIEEKEQQEKQRKRKSTSNANAVAEKDKELPADVTSSTKDNRRRNTRTVSVADRVSEKRVPPKLYADEQGVAYTRGGKLTKSNKKNTPAQAPTTITTTREEEPVSTTAVEQTNKIIATGAKSLQKSNKTPNKLNNQNNKKGNETAARPRRGGANTAKTKSKTPAKTKASSRRPSKAARPVETTEEEEEDEETNIADDDDDDDEDYLISELKQNNRLRANKSAAASTKKTVNARKAQVSSTGGSEEMVKESYKRGNNNNNSYGNTNVGRSKLSVQSQQQQQQGEKGPTLASKNKRKSQANQSSPRRKRMATEKLYYWSSSSDEDFGLINSQNQNNKSNVSSTALASAAAVTTNDNYDGGGKGGGGGVGVGGKGSGVSVGGKGLSGGVEQYQKHGWIVGDSHKKLVTLLAIAKGNNKKVDSNSGVKSKATKKRN